MTTKLDQIRELAKQLPAIDSENFDNDWDSLTSFRDGLIQHGILKRRPPSANHVRELTRIAVGQPLQAPRTVAARWAQRTAAKLSQQAYVAQ